MVHKTQGISLQSFLIFPTRHPSYSINIIHATFFILSLNLTLSHFHLSIFSLQSIPKISKMSQPFVSTPRKHTEEQSNPKNIATEINLSDVITDVIPLSMVHVHATPIRKARTFVSRKGKPSKVSTFSSPSMTARNVTTLEPYTAIKKPHSMSSLYLDLIIVKPNVSTSEECIIMPNVMEDVEASEINNRPMSLLL